MGTYRTDVMDERDSLGSFHFCDSAQERKVFLDRILQKQIVILLYIITHGDDSCQVKKETGYLAVIECAVQSKVSCAH